MLIKLLLGFDTAVFDATLPTTTSIIRGETEEERAEALAKTGKLASAGNMYRYLGSMMYNSKELLLARSIARENKHKEVQEREDREEEKEMALFEKADQAYLVFKEGGSLLCALRKPELQDIVRFLCCVEKKVGDTYTKHSGSNNKMRQRIAKVSPVWTKYFAPPEEEEEEEEEELTVNSDE